MMGLFGRLDRAQNSVLYKRVASVIVALLTIGVVVGLWVYANRPDAEIERVERLSSTPTGVLEQGPIGALRSFADVLVAQMTTGEGVATVLVGAGIVGAGAIAVVWLGLSLTYLCALLVGWLVAWPLMLLEATRTWGELLFGVVPLILVMLTLLRLARIALSSPTPVLAVAKNVLSEAVRMKISLVFIVILLLMLAVTPTALETSQPLRFRVQQWLTYGLGFSYGVLALLTVFLTVATVTFEQRDKIIWQTMTKPVRPWEYLIGKWMGVMVLNLCLLTVSAAGVFLFTEYLRYQPARGESSYMVDLEGNPTGLGVVGALASEDRRMLETQVLAARVAVEPISVLPTEESLSVRADIAIARDDALDRSDKTRVMREIRESIEQRITEAVDRRLENLRAQTEDAFVATEGDLRQRRSMILEEVTEEYRVARNAIPPGGQRVFAFDLRDEWSRYRATFERARALIEEEALREAETGAFDDEDERAMEAARMRAQVRLQEEGRIPVMPQMTLRFTVDAGTNDPRAVYDVYFAINGVLWPFPDDARGERGLRRVGLGQASSFDFPYWLLDRPDEDELDGIVEVAVANAPTNPRTMAFAEGNLQILYDAGGYQLNFLRTIAAMWLKLAFVAAVGVSLSTFLSFPVAALVTLGVLFAGESASFLTASLDNYLTQDREGNIIWWKVPIRGVAIIVSSAFSVYGELKPAEGIADGRLMSWGMLSRAALWIAGVSSAMFLMGWAIFRRRELAIYSGN